jgi:hypothetical protein
MTDSLETTDIGGAQFELKIDDTKIHVLRYGDRMRDVLLQHLEHQSVSIEVSEAMTWLKSLNF